MTKKTEVTNKPTHTLAPWTYEGAMNAPDILIGTPKTRKYQGKKEPMPIQYGQEIARVIIRGDMELGEANARLIAAALIDLENALDGGYSCRDPRHRDGTCPVCHARVAARAAIAKAEGK